MITTLTALVADHPSDALALGAPGRAWLTYGGLRETAARTAADLRRFGVGARDRVAIVLPNGPDMAASFYCIAQAATTAPDRKSVV